MITKKFFQYTFISSVVLGLILGGIFLYKNNKEVKIENNHFSFSYPKQLSILTVPSTEGNYSNYQITNPKVKQPASIITISLPLKNTSVAFSLLDNVKPFGRAADIKKVVLNGHLGESITYRQDTSWEGDVPVHGKVVYEQFATRYSTSPVILRYFRDDKDGSLDNYWKSIRDSITY